MSDSSDDDDLPDLESVDSSEYYSDDDESDMMSDVDDFESKKRPVNGVDKSSTFYAVAKKWLELDPSEIEKQLLVISVHLFSPFLFGHAHQSDRWLRWCHEVGLLISEFDYNRECLTAIELTAVDVLDKAMEHCRNCMMDRDSPDSLFMLLQLANDIKQFEDVEEAVREARHREWFKCMLEVYASDKDIGPISNSQVGKMNFIEIGCLYAINQTAEHVQKFVDGHELSLEFDESITSQIMSGESMKKQGDELFMAGKSEQAIEIYTTAIICCPYYYDLYLKRAYVYLELQKFHDAQSDSVRAIHLKPSYQDGYIRFIQCLSVCGEDKRLSIAQQKYDALFPGARNREQLRVGLDSSPAYLRRKIEATEEDKAQYEKLTGLCKQASEAYLQGNVDNALLYYDESVLISSQDEGWQHCMVLSESQRFMVALHFAYGVALLKKGSAETIESAIKQFTAIISDYVMIPFPPALYGLAKALAKLHRHSEALEKTKEGLKLLSSYHLPSSLNWPGTNEVLTEALAQNVEMLLQQLQQQCEPVNIPDAVCRYGNCLQYYASSDIQLKAADYKGHVTLQCTDSCSIAYHASCWRRFKTEGVTGADKDHLQSECPTPDCPGTIKTVSVYDNRGKIKIKYEAEAQSKKAPPTVSSAVATSSKESRRSSRSKLVKKKKASGSVSDVAAVDVAKETETKPDKPDKPDREDSLEDHEEEVLHKEEPAVPAPVKVSEDSRKTEDSLAVINRHAETEGVKEKEVGGGKTKTKKSKKQKAAESSMTKQWTELFTLPDRYCESSSATATEEEGKKQRMVRDKAKEEVDEREEVMKSWQRDPTHPFLPPEHLREAVDRFEKTEVPRLGLKPNPMTTPTTEEAMTSSHKSSSLADVDFVFSYFAEILKNCGPLKADDSRLEEALLLLPDEKRHFIAKYGGIEKYLLTSSVFVSHGNLICLAEDAPLIKDSISQSSSSTSSNSSLGSDSTSEKTSKTSVPASVGGNTRAVSKNSKGRNAFVSSSSSEKPSLGSQVDPQHDTLSCGGGGNSLKFDSEAKGATKTYGVELGSSVNSPSTSPVDSPRLLSPSDHISVTSGTGGVAVVGSNGSSGRGKQHQKVGSTAHGVAKRPSSAGETRENAKSGQTSLHGNSGSKPSNRAVGHERQQKREGNRKDKGRNGGGSSVAGGVVREKPPERLLSTASDSSLGIIGDFFAEVTAAVGQKDQLGRSYSGSSGSCSGSQGEEPLPAASALANSKMLRAAMSVATGSKPTPTSTSSPGIPPTPGTVTATGVSPAVSTRDATVQTLPTRTGVKFVQTDHLPSVENFKERYEKVLKEKRDLQLKLERSEDQKFKVQRDHKREVEKLEKKYYTEAKKEAESKIHELEERVIEERQKGLASKKDQAELIRSHKAEIKSLVEKVEKMKKEVGKKDAELDTNMVQYHTEIEQLRSEKRRFDDRVRSEMENQQKALRRAIDAELEVLNMRRDAVARPCEQRLKEVEAICANTPPGSEFQRDWITFKEKLRTSLDCFLNAMDDQLRQVKSGRELVNLDRVPNPSIPIPGHLRVPMPMMRPRFMPMMPVRGAPMPAVPGGLVMDPGAFAGQRMPMPHMPIPMGNPHLQLMEGGNSMSDGDAAAGGEQTDGDIDAKEQPSVAQGGGANVDTERGVGGAVGGASSAAGKKKSSFERIVEKLAPVYPHYAREDFKTVLHEVRRNNRNTLSGLSLDSITEQVKAIIDSREKGRSSSAHNGGSKGAASGSGKRQNKTSKSSSRQQPSSRSKSRPQVAVAEPPILSATDYDEDGSCIICYEDMIDFDSSRLNCGHRFHTDCIKSWFKEQSTCPTCRNHSLLPEEYPFLK